MSVLAPPFVGCEDFASWGRVVREPQQVARPRFRDELATLTSSPGWASKLAVGLRRSYGDTCLNSRGALIDTTSLDRLISFDAAHGRLRAEAGVSLSRLLRFCVPQGWFPATTPGTRYVTLGGAVANDVHGKNHHSAGSLGRSVLALGLVRSDGRRLSLSPHSDPQLFNATIGGLGLTGVIEWVELQLTRIGSSYLDVELVPYENLDAFWPLAAQSVQRFEHTVAWIDCTAGGRHTGRGVLSRANWRDDGRYVVHDDRTIKVVPFEVPARALNRWSVSAFNELYYRAHRLRAGATRQHYAQFFYPLDSVRNWNRLYGKPGMLQYQCVVPWGDERHVVGELLDEIVASGQASFLAVLKTFGDPVSPGVLTFPRPGVTLALDFPNRGPATLALFARLDAIVRDARGALYPAKDGRMPADMFVRSFPRWEEFASLRDPGMSSDFWRRVSDPGAKP